MSTAAGSRMYTSTPAPRCSRAAGARNCFVSCAEHDLRIAQTDTGELVVGRVRSLEHQSPTELAHEHVGGSVWIVKPELGQISA